MRKRWLMVMGLLLSLAGVGSLHAQQSGFTEGERAQLVGGELVRRGLSRPRPGQLGGVSWMRVHAPIDEVWRVASDPDAMTRLVPTLERVEILETRGATRIARLHHSLGIGETSYVVRLDLNEAEHSMRLEIDRAFPRDFDGGHGYLRLTSFRGDTIVEWGMVVDSGSGLLGDVFGPMVNERLLLPPRCLRDDIEHGPDASC